MFQFDTCIVCFTLTHYNRYGVLKMLHIKEIRKRCGKSQQEVADYLQIQRASYSNIENNKRDPDTEIIFALSEFFQCSIDEIFGKSPAKPERLTENQRRVMMIFNGLNAEGQEKAIDYLEYLSSRGYIKSVEHGLLPEEETS